MSYQQLQRVVVRMLYDPALVAQIFADPATALRDEDLTDPERRWLVETDRRAYAVDPLRRARTLAALIEEFPVSVQQLIQQTGQPELLEAFFSSPHFHTCIQQRGSLAVAFSEYMLSAALQYHSAGLALSHLVQLELAVARLRRQYGNLEATSTAAQNSLKLVPTVALLPLPVGTLAHYQAAHDVLSSDTDGLIAAACKPSTLPAPQETQDDEWLLIVWHQDSAAIEILPEALGHLLVTTPAPRSALIATAGAFGAEADEANEIINDLIADGILCEEMGARSRHD
jgi:hypothetical protein